MRVITVPLGKRSYSIHIGQGLLSRLGAECAALGNRRAGKGKGGAPRQWVFGFEPAPLGGRCAVITDHRVEPHYAGTALRSLKQAGFEPALVVVPAGETAKSLRTVATCYKQLAAHRLERSSFIVALGGGVVGDLAGFVAATYLRGIALVQVPTTLLAQVDSSVGGKVGVNLPAGKNLVGAFFQPRLVVCDLATLQTLPEREFRAGLAEVIKYGIIYDPRLFTLVERDLEKLLRLEPTVLGQVVARCCEIKAEVVRADETESGLRAMLNFGHTIGHALEAIGRYGKYLHGEAIAIGQVAAARLSRALLGLPERDCQRIEKLFQRVGLPTKVKLRPAQWTALLQAMRLDKKVRGGELRFVLIQRLGEVCWNQPVPERLVRDVLG